MSTYDVNGRCQRTTTTDNDNNDVLLFVTNADDSKNNAAWDLVVFAVVVNDVIAGIISSSIHGSSQ